MSKQKKSKKQNNKSDSSLELKSYDFFDYYFKEKSVYVLAVLISVITLIVYGTFFFTENIFMFKDIGSDTINVFYPNYYWFAECWENEGRIPSWSFATGLGQDIILGTKGDPFLWILFFLGKDTIADGLAYIEALKVMLSGLAFYYFLRTLKLTYIAAVIGGLCYAFSGFMMVGSGWLVFTLQGLYYALLLLSFERFILGKWLMFPLIIALILLFQPTDLFAVSILLSVYGIPRILYENENDLKDLLFKLIKLIGLGILGVMISAILFIPSIYQIINSPRILGESSYFSSLINDFKFFVDTDLLQTTKARFFSNDLVKDPNNNWRGAMNFFEAPATYSGLISILLFPMAIFSFNKREKIYYGLSYSIFLIPLFIPILRQAFWLFSGDYYRLYSLFVVIILLTISARVLNHIFHSEKFNWIGLIFGSFLSFLALFTINGSELIFVNEEDRYFISFLLILNILSIALCAVKSFKFIGAIMMMIILIIDLISVSKPTLNDRSIATFNEFYTYKSGYNDYTKEAMNFIDSIDQSFFRLEKLDYHSGIAIHGSINDAKVQGYFGTKSYQSFNHLNYIRFLDELNVIDASQEHQTRWAPGPSRQLLNMMVSNKYVLSKNNNINNNSLIGYSYLKSFGDINIYVNDNFLPFGFTYDSYFIRSIFDTISSPIVKKDISLMKSFIVDDDDFDKVNILKSFDPSILDVNTYSLDQLSMDIDARKSNYLDITSFKNSEIKGEIELYDTKLMFLSIPFDKGWDLFVNGIKKPMLKVNIGFSGVLLPKGKHEIELKYTTPYMDIGIYLTILGLIILSLLMYWYFKKNGNIGL